MLSQFCDGTIPRKQTSSRHCVNLRFSIPFSENGKLYKYSVILHEFVFTAIAKSCQPHVNWPWILEKMTFEQNNGPLFLKGDGINPESCCEGHFPQGVIFHAERNFLSFKDQLVESGVKTKRTYRSTPKVSESFDLISTVCISPLL